MELYLLHGEREFVLKYSPHNYNALRLKYIIHTNAEVGNEFKLTPKALKLIGVIQNEP